MRILLYGDTQFCQGFSKKFSQLNYVDHDPDIVISLGGDGTFLKAVHEYGLDTCYLPINCGTLGFFSSYDIDNFDIKNIDFNHISEYIIPEVNVNNNSFFFINEVRIINHLTTSNFTLKINNTDLDYRASGIEIVAPFGTTGCSRANMGPIIAPSKQLYSIKAILGVNNSKYKTLDNPIILDYSDDMKLLSDSKNNVTIDGIDYGVDDNIELSIKICDKKLKIIESNLNNYYKLIKEKII